MPHLSRPRARLAALGALLTAATVAPLLGVSAEAAAPQQRVSVTDSCGASVGGIDRDNRLVGMSVKGSEVIATHQTAVLDFPVQHLALMGWSYTDDTRTAGTNYFRTISLDARPRRLDVGFEAGNPDYTTPLIQKFTNRTFNARLFAGTFGYHVLVVRGDRLIRYVTYADSAGRLSYDDPVVVTRLAGLTTLGYVNRRKVEGRKADIYLATTTTGRLLEIRIPVRKPRLVDVVRLRKHGFSTVTGISIGGCSATDLGFVAIDAAANTARWYRLAHPFAPKPADLTEGDLVGVGEDWARLHSVL